MLLVDCRPICDALALLPSPASSPRLSLNYLRRMTFYRMTCLLQFEAKSLRSSLIHTNLEETDCKQLLGQVSVSCSSWNARTQRLLETPSTRQ
jgi:hypothetical protein